MTAVQRIRAESASLCKSNGSTSSGSREMGLETVMGGASNFGTVFSLNTTGEEAVLYGFTGGTDGANPYAGLIIDAKGFLYGTAFQGGAYSFGTVFELIP